MTLALPARAQTQPAEEAVLEASATEATVDTTMSASERMIVQVTIGGAGPYPFIIDTAAERTVVARDLARAKSGMPPAGRARLLSMTSSRDAAVVSMRDVSFMHGQARTLRAFALNGQYLGASGSLVSTLSAASAWCWI